MNWMMAIFPLIHVGVGISLTYSTLTGFLNHTTIDLLTSATTPGRTYRDPDRHGDATLTVRHAPLPWRGNQRLSATSLRGFTAVEREIRNKQSSKVVYDVAAIDADGRQRTLVKNLSRDEAEYLGQAFTERLGLPA